MSARLAAAAIYLGLTTLWIYGVADRDSSSGAGALLLLIFLQLAGGLAVGRWWAVLLPAFVVLASVPAGLPPVTDGSEPLPIWFGLAYFSPVGSLLIAIGVATRKILDRLSRSTGTARAGR